MNASFKTTLIGGTATGKSSIVVRMVHNTFNNAYACTIGASFFKLIRQNITYLIQDTSGSNRFDTLLPMYFRGTSIFIFVFDMSNLDSVRNFDRYITKLNELETYKIIVVGNKIDLIEESYIDITKNNLKQKFTTLPIADKIFDYVFVSAKTGVGMNNFYEVLDACGIEMGKLIKDVEIDKEIKRLDVIVKDENNSCAC
jgi:small GTP-binding protein